MQMQTQNPQIVAYGTAYLRTCCTLSFGLFLQVTFERLLLSTGKTHLSMITQTMGAIINIILDPIMIFGLFGFPRMEVAGAALATVTGQIIASIAALILNRKKNHEIHLTFRNFKFSGMIVKNMLLQIFSASEAMKEIGIPALRIISLCFILAKAGGLHAVWWAFPISEIFASALCVCFLYRVYKKEIDPLGK